MKAVVITRFGGPEVLEIQNVPAPQRGADEVLVHVRSTAPNRADLLQRLSRTDFTMLLGSFSPMRDAGRCGAHLVILGRT